MKRFYLFRGRDYYPHGGMQDYVASFASLDEAKAAANVDTDGKPQGDWAHVAELTDDGLRLVTECFRSPEGAFWEEVSSESVEGEGQR